MVTEAEASKSLVPPWEGEDDQLVDELVDELEEEEEEGVEDSSGQLDLSQYTPDELRLLRTRYKQAEHLQKMVRSVSLLEGKKGRGKTLAAVSICYNLKEFFDIPTVCVGSSMDLVKRYYGDYVFLDDKEFINELSRLTTVGKNTEDTEIGDAIEETLKMMGVNVTNACLVFDEAYKFFDARTPSDKLVRVFGYFVAQSRHYKCTILLLSPYRDMIDKRVRRQIDYYGRCFTNSKTRFTTVRMSGGMESWRFKIFGPNYYNMYDTHTLLGFRAKHLQIGL